MERWSSSKKDAERLFIKASMVWFSLAENDAIASVDNKNTVVVKK
jgi:hypothetical protein